MERRAVKGKCRLTSPSRLGCSLPIDVALLMHVCPSPDPSAGVSRSSQGGELAAGGAAAEELLGTAAEMT